MPPERTITRNHTLKRLPPTQTLSQLTLYPRQGLEIVSSLIVKRCLLHPVSVTTPSIRMIIGGGGGMNLSRHLEGDGWEVKRRGVRCDYALRSAESIISTT